MAGPRAAPGLLADGLTRDIISQLGRARWLFVTARGSTFHFRAGPYDPRDIGRALGVRYVVQGDVQSLGSRIGVYASLADATVGTEIWADRLDATFETSSRFSGNSRRRSSGSSRPRSSRRNANVRC